MDRPPWYFFHRTRDVTHEDHLGVVIVGTTTFFWTEDGWQTQLKELWVWQLFPGNWETRIWAPKLLSDIESLHYQQGRQSPLHWRLINLCTSRWDQVIVEAMSSSSSSFVPGRNRSVVISVAASNFADYIRNSGKSESYDLYRVCRLVCRGWARQLLLDDLSPIGRKIKEDISRDNTHIRGGGPRITIRGGVVRFLLQKEWQTLPNELWAWRLVRPCDLWWMRIWVPELLSPIQYWQYHRQWAHTQSSPRPSESINSTRLLSQSTTTIEHPNVPSMTTIVATRLFEYIRRSEHKKLCRTCRLVCRDWAGQFLLGFSEPWNLRVEDGAAWYRFDAEWIHLPNGRWAWSFQDFSNEWWVEGWSEPGKHCQWYLKLVQPIDVSIQSNCTRSCWPSPVQSETAARSVLATAAALPEELFNHICRGADNESRSLRLVCRHWNRLCTPRVFEQVDVKWSPKRIRALWKGRMGPVMQHTKVVEHVPPYMCGKRATFPWVHLLTQACASIKSVWKMSQHLGRISISGGRLTDKYQTIRSVHFALPRSVPRSLSRGIRQLQLRKVPFRRLEDLAHLVCELPDLEELCWWPNLDLLPTQLPRRRARTNRNKLRLVNIIGAKDGLPALTLFLSAYDVKSFLSTNEIVITLALLQPLNSSRFDFVVVYEKTHQDQVHRLDFKHPGYPERTILAVHMLQDPIQNGIILDVIADCRYATMDEDLERWMRLDTEFSKIGGLIQQAGCVFGFADRHEMIYFATVILVKMPSISKLATLHYSVHIKDGEDKSHPGRWYRASLDSEDLTGTAWEDLAKVYS